MEERLHHRSGHGTHTGIKKHEMRFTVKAKLASAFGAVIVPSMITGGLDMLVFVDEIKTNRDRAGKLYDDIKGTASEKGKNCLRPSGPASIV